MKTKFRVLFTVLTIATVLLSACGAGSGPVAGGAGKAAYSSIPYAGVVESINGNQWVINGQPVTVDSSVVQGPVNVGDQVRIEVRANSGGAMTVTSVQIASASDFSQLPQFGPDAVASSVDDNSNDGNGNDANVNDDNGNDDNGNGDNANDANVNDGDDSNVNDGDDSNVNDDDDSNVNDGNDNGGNDNGGNDNGGNDNGGNDNGGGGNDNGGGGGGGNGNGN